MPRTPAKPKPTLKLKPPRDPLVPAVPTVDVIAAYQALFRGDASKDQQQRAMEFLLIEICGCTSRTFSTTPGVGAFAEGQRDVGLQINGLRSIDLRAIEIAMKENKDG